MQTGPEISTAKFIFTKIKKGQKYDPSRFDTRHLSVGRAEP